MIVSVIIPCRNEEKNIEECIRAIYSNSINTEFDLEVLVVDGLSDDGTLKIIERLQQEYSSLKVIINNKKVTPVAFNLGIKNANGEFIQIIGARQIVSQNYISAAISCFKNDPALWCVGGAVENVFMDEMSRLIGEAMGSSFGVGVGNFRILEKSKYVDTVGTPMYKRSVFDEVGFFDEDLVRNQDDEFNYRITSKGGKILLSTDMKIKYYVRASFKNLFRQYFQYGFWKVFVNLKHKTFTNLRQLIPFFFVLFLFTGSILSFLNHKLFISFLVILGIYVFMAIYFSSKSKGGIKDVLVRAWTYFILHLSYGLGYADGIIQFFFLNKKPGKKGVKLSR